MALNDYVDIQIALEAETVSREGFGTLLFITEDATEAAGAVTGPFSSLAEVDDVYASGTEPRKFAAAAFAQGAGFSALVVYHKADDLTETWVDAISNAVDAPLSWYGLAVETREAADILAVAAEVEARGKLFIAATNDADILDPQESGDLASTLLGQSLSRTAVLYHSDAVTTYPEAAWFGRMLPTDPGTQNWAYKSLATISPDSFTGAQRGALRSKRCNYYEVVAGNPVTFAGYTSELGVYLDIVRGLDWLRVRMQEDFIARQVANPIPYRSPGPEIIESIVRSRLSIAANRGIITEAFSVFVPDARDQQASDRAARHFPGITFNAELVGFSNTVAVRGTVQV